MTPEFSRRYPVDTIGTTPRSIEITATTDECAALAVRFDLISLDALRATATLIQSAAGIGATGRLEATLVQPCVVTGEPVPSTVAENFSLRFVDPALLAGGGEEVELNDADCDVMELDGSDADLGEAVAQTMGLALDPFPRSAAAGPDEQRWSAGPDAGPFAGLKGLLNP